MIMTIDMFKRNTVEFYKLPILHFTTISSLCSVSTKLEDSVGSSSLFVRVFLIREDSVTYKHGLLVV